VRAIEKTVSSLIPPTAAFRLPAVRQRIGSGEGGSFEQSYAIPVLPRQIAI